MPPGASTPNRQASAVKSFFLGNILEENLFPFPQLKASERETLAMVIESLDRFMAGKEKDFRHFDEKGAQPDEFINALKELGLFGLIIPEEFGGIGLSNTGYSRVVQQISRFDGSTAVTIGAHSSIGMKALLLFGNDSQKAKYLPALATGEMVAAFCLTEPGSGSDAASITTLASRNADGSWSLNGEKIWISNGAFADFFTVFARTESGEKGKLSAFIVERKFGGLSTGPKEDKLGIRSSATTTVRFDNVRVPAENLLGEEGKGFKIAMSVLNNGRTGLGGGAVGGIKTCIALAAKQSAERKQFGKSISSFGLVKEKIAQMAVDCFATESVVQMIGHYIDDGVEDCSVEAAVSKVFASEALWRSANEALQIAGGNGYMKEFPYERILRDSRINLIFEGTNEILRLYIGLSGMKEAGQNLKNIGKAAGNIFNDPIKGFGMMSSYASRKVSQLTTIGRERLDVPEILRGEAMIYELGTLGLSKTTEAVLRKYGKNVVDQQLITKRLANAAIDLFTGVCMLSRVSALLASKSVEACKFEISMLQMFGQQAKRRLKQELGAVEREEDPLVDSISDFVVEQGRYIWDLD